MRTKVLKTPFLRFKFPFNSSNRVLSKLFQVKREQLIFFIEITKLKCATIAL